MDRDTNTALERLLDRASRSAIESLEARVNVEQRLRELFQEVGIDPDPLKRGDRDDD